MNNIFIAMIPARIGSKRIPKKNIRYMLDKPLIQYPIELALGSNKLQSIWVNTESAKLGEISQKWGAKFHKRPQKLSSDTATNREFTYEFLQKHMCDYVIMINPTSPLLKADTLNCFLEFVDNNNFDTVLSVVSEKTETFFRKTPVNFSPAEKINSQLLEPSERVVWALTAWKRKSFIELQEKNINPIFGGNIGLFSIPKDESCDLDTLEDWKIAEGILTARMLKNFFDERYVEL